MNRRLAVAAALAASLVSASSSHAITYGVRDDGEHPYVGFILFFDASEPGWFSCSGTLLSPTVFLTAGHCAFDIGTSGAPTPGGSGGNDVWATFDEVIDTTGFPARDDYPDEASLYAARSAWLNANPHVTRGTSHAHPSYDDFASFPHNHDIGVIVLDAPAAVGSFAELAPVGTLDQLASRGKGHNKVLLESVGYGIQEVKPHPLALDERWKSTSRIVNLKSALTDGFNVHTSNNPSPSGGRGGTCFGDSGGGVFLNNTSTVVAVVSFGQNDNCKGADYEARTDIDDSRDFVLPFLGD